MHDESLGLKIIAASGTLPKIDVKTKKYLGTENNLNNLSIIT